MASPGNGINRTNGNSSEGASRLPRRLVLLQDGEASAVVDVLAEYAGEEVSGNRLHEALQHFAAQHPGRYIAGEWLGALGWVRFLWCRK